MSDVEKGQVSAEAAEVYAELFVPALFAPWSARMVRAVAARPGDHALDVGCGTGVLAEALTRAVGSTGHVTGLDVNEGMLAVARRTVPGVTWHTGAAESLPYERAAFDVVASQFALMFFRDRVRGLREMRRVLRPGGRMALVVWGPLTETPGYAAMHGLLYRMFGADIARSLEAPYELGAVATFDELLTQAGLTANIETIVGEARFPSLERWLETDIRGWTLADAIDDAQFDALLEASRDELARFVQPDGSVSFTTPAHIATVRA